MEKSNNGIIRAKERFHLKKNNESGLYFLVFPKDDIIGLADNLFSNTDKIGDVLLEEVDIPDNIKIIGNKCFMNCTNIQKVTISDLTTKLGSACFRGCKKLKNITLPRNITVLPEYFLSWCSSLSKVKIPEGVTTLLDGCFFNCTNLETIILPQTISQIGNFVFSECTSLKHFSFNDNIKYISDELFSDCQNLEEVTLPSGLNSIGKKAFSRCHKLKAIKLPDSLSVIGEEAFEDCSVLTDITIPSSVTRIGLNAFSNCGNLESVTILPNSNKKFMIQNGAFSDCQNIRTLNLPRGALNNQQAFDFGNMPNLKSITYAGKKILNLSDKETFSNLLYNGKLIYIEYINEAGKVVSKVMEDISYNKLLDNSIGMTEKFHKLCSHPIIQNNFKLDEKKNKLCLNMLSILDYKICLKLLDLLQESYKKNSISDATDEKECEINKSKKNKKVKSKTLKQEDIQQEAEKKSKRSWFNRIKINMAKLFKKEYDDNTVMVVQKVTLPEFIDTIFSSPKIYNNNSIKDFEKFFSDNLNNIVNMTNSEQVENLAKIQRNFQKFIKNPILRRKIQTGKFTLQEALQNKNLYSSVGGTEDFSDIRIERNSPNEYQKSDQNEDIEL